MTAQRWSGLFLNLNGGATVADIYVPYKEYKEYPLSGCPFVSLAYSTFPTATENDRYEYFENGRE